MDVGRHWCFFPTLQKLEANLLAFCPSETVCKAGALKCGGSSF